MSKELSESQSTPIKPINISVGIKRRVMDDMDLQEFLEARKKKDPIAQGSLVEYVKEKFYKGQDVVVVPDLSGQHIEGAHDLRGVDFSGVKLTGAHFQFCKLEGASFCDADLSKVDFFDCEMSGADMRGADLSFCKIAGFGEKWEAYKKEVDNAKRDHLPVPEVPEALVKNYKGMKFSSTADLMTLYGEINRVILSDAEKEFAKEKQAKLVLKDKEVSAAWEKVSYSERAFGGDNYTAYDKLRQERAAIDRSVLDKETVKYIIDPSLVYIPKSPESFDPGYVRGSSKKERDQEKQYVELNRGDVEAYLVALKTTPDLTLNDFAKSKAAEKGIELHEGSKPVAYAKYGTDLSNLDFTGANLQEACFVGAAFRGCNFTGANLTKSIFESAVVTGATFKNTRADDANFFYCFLDKSTVVDSSFKRAFMRGSEAIGMQVTSSNFDYSNVRNGKWDGVNIQDATFNYADLEGVSLANAKLSQVKMQHAMLEKAILNGCEIIESDLTGAFLEVAKVRKAKIQDTVLKDVDARGIDLTETEIDKLCKLEGADLDNAIMKMVKADGVNFVGAHMDGANLEHAQMKEAVLEGVSMRFSNLEGAVLEGVRANGVDMTGANVTDIKAKKGQFKEAILEGIEGQKADFTEAVMEGAKLRGAKVKEAIMEKVNLKKADLRDAELQKANLRDAEVEGVKINEGTDINQAEITGVKGTAIHEGVDGVEKPMKLETKKEIDAQVHAAEGKGFFSKLAGNVLKGIGGGCKKVADFIRQPISTKWGRIIGAVAGALIVGAIVASAVVTGGASLVVIAGAVAGAVAVGAVGGAVAGHFGAKHMGLSTVAAGVAGGVLIPGPVGVGVGLAVGVGANKAVKVATGIVTGTEQSIDELVGNVVDGVGNGAKRLGEHIGVSEEQERLVAAKKKCQENYVAPEREPTRGKGHGKEAFVQGREEALRLDEMGIQVPPQSVSKEKPKTHSLNDGLKSVKETLSRSEPVVETRPRSRSSVGSVREV